MNDLTQNFGRLVTKYVGGLSTRRKLPLQRLREDVFQLDGLHVVMRIRRSNGHKQDVLFTIVECDRANTELDDLSSEVGLGVVAEFRGQALTRQEFSNPEQQERAFGEATSAIEEFCLPYLMKETGNLADIRNYVEKKIEESGSRTKKYVFPKNVRLEWI